MENLKVFSNSEFGELGVLVIDGKEFFPATQCAKVLGYVNPKKAVLDHCKGVTKRDLPTNGGVQQVNYIPEGDLYRLIVSSKLPAAEKFERWVFDEVLPELHRAGTYGQINIEDIIAKTATAVVMEVMKQLVPVLTAAVQNKPVSEYVEEKTVTKKSYKRYRNDIYQANCRTEMSQPMKIDLLEDEIKQEVDRMILSGKYSHREVAQFIMKNSDMYISQASVSKYARNRLNVRIWNVVYDA